MSNAKDLCTLSQLHRFFAAKNAAEDDKLLVVPDLLRKG